MGEIRREGRQAGFIGTIPLVLTLSLSSGKYTHTRPKVP